MERCGVPEWQEPVLRLISDQHAIPLDQLAGFLGLYMVDAERLVDELVGVGFAARESLLQGEADWVWLRLEGERAAVTGFGATSIRIASLVHWRAINEARLQVEGRGVPGLEWVSERRLRRAYGHRVRGFLPDAEVLLDGERHAIEVELSAKPEAMMRERLSFLESRYDRVVYFASRNVRRHFARLGLAEEFSDVVVRPIAVRPRLLSRSEWRVGDGDPALRGSGAVPADREVRDAEREILDLIFEQHAIPLDQLARFLGLDEAAAARTVEGLVARGLLRRARPLPKEPVWVWLSEPGALASSLRLNRTPPSLGRLAHLRAMNDVRLLVSGRADGLTWVSRRVLRRRRGRRGSVPHALVEVDGERHAIDVLLTPAPPAELRARLESREADADAVLWFAPRRVYWRLERFAVTCGSAKLVVRPLPGDESAVRVRVARRRRRKGCGSVPAGVREYLATAPTIRMEPVVPDSMPEGLFAAIEEVLEGDCRPVLAAWRKRGSGPAVGYVVTAAGSFRVTHAAGGWRAHRVPVACEDLFLREEGPAVPWTRSRRGRMAPRLSARSLEFDAELWESLAPLVPPEAARRKGPRGQTSLDDRLALSGVLWVLRNEVGWHALPRELGYGSGIACRRRLRWWQEVGAWGPLRERLEGLLPDGRELDWPSLTAPRRSPHPRRARPEPQALQFDDATWSKLAPFVPAADAVRKGPSGTRSLDDRLALSAILWFLRNEVSWSRLPFELGYGSPTAVRQRLWCWEALGAWDGIRGQLEESLPDGRDLDWSRLPAPRGSRRPRPEGSGSPFDGGGVSSRVG